MPRKVFQVQVELEIQAVTCPGVWLCPNGKVSLQVYMLDSCVETSSLEPVFPLLCHEKFLFYKIYDKANRLSDLQKFLSNEYFYAELIQWRDCDVGNVLATFQSSLSDVLYPRTMEGAIAGVDIDLLMEPSKRFPGIIAPKIEVSTKTTVEETLCTNHHRKCSAFVVNPKVIQSEQCPNRLVPKRQRKVCHSLGYHVSRKCHPSSRKGRRPSFHFRKADDDLISRKPQGLDVSEIPCKCCARAKKFDKHNRVSPGRRTYTDITEEFLRNYKRKFDRKRCSPAKTAKCICGSGHMEFDCPVCAKYKNYFNETPICISPRYKTKQIHSCISPHTRKKCGCTLFTDTKPVDCKSRGNVEYGEKRFGSKDDAVYIDKKERLCEKEDRGKENMQQGRNKQPDHNAISLGRCYPDDIYEIKNASAGNSTRESSSTEENESNKSCFCTPHNKESMAENIHKRLSKTLKEVKDGSCTYVKDICEEPNAGGCLCPKAAFYNNKQRTEFYDTLDRFYKKLYKKAHGKAKYERSMNYLCSPVCPAC